MMPIIDITNCFLDEADKRLGKFDLLIGPGDHVLVTADSQRTVNLLFRGLATLSTPVSGHYRFNGSALDFSKHHHTLWCKKKIGYISPAMTMISNRTIMDNLLLPRCYEENTLAVTPSDELKRLCSVFNITLELDQRVAKANLRDVRMAAVIREIIKSPDIFLLERPEEMISPDRFNPFVELMKKKAATGTPLLLFSRDQKFIDNFLPNKRIVIKGNTLTTK
jgi:ABC-type lipoprotein export system ATPase subunit